MAGRFFDQWTVGERIAHEVRRTVTEADNLLVTALTHDPRSLPSPSVTSSFARVRVRPRDSCRTRNRRERAWRDTSRCPQSG